MSSSRWTFLDVLEYLEGFSVLIAVIFYFSESGDRLKQKHYQAWQVINTAQGKAATAGASKRSRNSTTMAFLWWASMSPAHFFRTLHLEHAPLAAFASFSDADLRDSDFAIPPISPTPNLRSANFRAEPSAQRSVSTRRSCKMPIHPTQTSVAPISPAQTLNDADLTNANLSNFTLAQRSATLKNANLFGVKNSSPEDFIAWAKQRGAIQTATNPSQ